MSNRRKPRRLVPLDGGQAPPQTGRLQSLPFPLEAIEWTDEPAYLYEPQVLAFIAAHARERGRLNVWVCETCEQGVLCVDRHPGVTPFMVAHSTLGGDCDGTTRSVFYSRAGVLEHAPRQHGHTDLEPTHEWYRPSATELRGESRAVRAHVEQGGLLVRERA